jgi:hypothetical protein
MCSRWRSYGAAQTEQAKVFRAGRPMLILSWGKIDRLCKQFITQDTAPNGSWSPIEGQY